MILKSQFLDDERVPKREIVVHRGDRLKEILSEVRRAPGSIGDRNLFFTGPSGSGKTMLVRLAAKRARREWTRRPAYVDCWDHYTRSDILYQVGKQVLDAPVDPDIHSRKEVLELLLEEPSQYRHVILDEADGITEPEVLRDLYNCPKMQLIMIGHTQEGLWAAVPEHVESRIRAGRLFEHHPYKASELADMLEERAKRALPSGVISERKLERVAGAADGDARTAIKTLRIAAENAGAEDSRRITSEHIEQAIPKAGDEIHRENLERLTHDQEVLYEIVCEEAPISPGDLYEQYHERVEDPRTERTVRNYVSKLEHYDVVIVRGKSSARRVFPGNADLESELPDP